MSRVRITQLDGKLPNLALMKLAAYHRARGDDVHGIHDIERSFEDLPGWDYVYGSAIFSRTAPRVAAFLSQFPTAVIGGTWDVTNPVTVEEIIASIESQSPSHVGPDFDGLDYDLGIWQGFTASIGFTARGCRLKCGFCVVPKKEGKPRSVKTIEEIWRGPPYPRHLHLLDNDFFGQPEEQWRARIDEIRRGGFKACLNQGINVRMITAEAAAALASIDYADDGFRLPRLYTAWDNIGDEKIFFRGVDMLERAGVPPKHLYVYMLVGYDRRETWERVLYRFERMHERGIKPYPMVYGDKHRLLPPGDYPHRVAHHSLGDFQRWVIGRYHQVTPFHTYEPASRDALRSTQLELV